MPNKNIDELFKKYKEGTCTEEEKALIEAWYLQYEDLDGQPLSESETAADLKAIRAALPLLEHRPKHRVLWRQIGAAAAVIIVIFMATLAVLTKDQTTPSIAINKRPVIKPGGNKAFLTLADGSTIVLNDAQNGTIAEQPGIAITKTADGQLVYTAKSEQLQLEKAGSNTIVTPRGGQYQVKLPDGTKVWLNAESSLKYPTSFGGEERRVELTGEAYFEVAHNRSMPFRVVSSNQVVEVLGTHFNISSYANEPFVKTTLLEGSVIVKSSAQQTLLKPGQQALLNPVERTMTTMSVNVESAVAWKNGYFMFNNENLPAIMRKLARWYDLEVVYKGKIADKTFGGTISKFENVTEVLKTIELTGVIHFNIEGRRIIVTP